MHIPWPPDYARFYAFMCGTLTTQRAVTPMSPEIENRLFALGIFF